MNVRCPECKTLFRIADEKIGPDGTKVRCGKCRHVFLASRGSGPSSGSAPPGADGTLRGEEGVGPPSATAGAPTTLHALPAVSPPLDEPIDAATAMGRSARVERELEWAREAEAARERERARREQHQERERELERTLEQQRALEAQRQRELAEQQQELDRQREREWGEQERLRGLEAQRQEELQRLAEAQRQAEALRQREALRRDESLRQGEAARSVVGPWGAASEPEAAPRGAPSSGQAEPVPGVEPSGGVEALRVAEAAWGDALTASGEGWRVPPPPAPGSAPLAEPWWGAEAHAGGAAPVPEETGDADPFLVSVEAMPARGEAVASDVGETRTPSALAAGDLGAPAALATGLLAPASSLPAASFAGAAVGSDSQAAAVPPAVSAERRPPEPAPVGAGPAGAVVPSSLDAAALFGGEETEVAQPTLAPIAPPTVAQAPRAPAAVRRPAEAESVRQRRPLERPFTSPVHGRRALLRAGTLVLGLAGILALFVLWRNDWRLEPAPVMMSRAFGGAGMPRVRTQIPGLSASNVRRDLFESASGEPLLTISGELENDSSAALGSISVLVRLFDHAGNPLTEREQFAVGLFEPHVLSSFGSAEAVDLEYKRRRARSAIGPGGRLDFMIVFCPLPRELEGTRVRVLVEVTGAVPIAPRS